MTRAELEANMEATFGPDWQNKTLVGPLSIFHLRDVYEECGFEPPHRPEPNGSYGLFQFDLAASAWRNG